MRELLLSNRRYFIILTLAAVALRLYFVLHLPVISGDALVYSDIARNVGAHHVYGISTDVGPQPTLIRLPGYPFFLAVIFKIFGQDAWRPVMLVQALFDVITCFVVAETARLTINARAAKIAFALAALCPFTANYAGTGLTESLSLFFIALALLFAVRGLDGQKLIDWAGCGAAVALAILLRPDGGWLLGAIGLAILIRMWVIPGERRTLFKAGVVVLAISLAPLVPWTARNWRVFHVVQPLVTPHASDPGEWEPAQWMTWLNTWVIDYSNIEDVTFKVSGEKVDFNDIPDRAFSDEQEKQQVALLIAKYNEDVTLTQELDTEFGKIAARHVREHPFKYYVGMPVMRLIAVWVRPRTEMLPLDTHWWRFNEDIHDSLWGTGLLLLNLAFLYIAVRGVLHGPPMKYIALFILYLVVRSFFLLLMNAGEDRYTLEGFPCLFILGARYLAGTKMFQSLS